MSGIFGIIAPRGAQVDPERFARLGAAMRHWGDDQPSTCAVEGAAMGMNLLRTLPEDGATSMPVHVVERDLLFAAEGRVDNRDEMCRLLGVDGRDAATWADTTVILHAYLRWGAACQDHLVGDWSLAAWHAVEQQLVLTRDRSGHASLVFHHDPGDGSVVFASDPKALHAIGVPRRLNDLYLAQLLISWPAYHGPQTIDLDIVRVPPANVCTVERTGWSMRRTWFPEAMPLLAPSSIDECAEALLEVLDTAVRARCRAVGPIATTLSGGLDSGSVTALAARAVGGDRLVAYTHVPLFSNEVTASERRFGDETALATATALHTRVGRHVLLETAHVSPLAGIDRSLTSLGEPTHAASNAFWIGDLLQHASDDGARVLLTGQTGNGTISWTGGRGGPFRRLRRSGARQAMAWFEPLFIERRRAQRSAKRRWFDHTALRAEAAASLDLPRQWAQSIGVHPARPSKRVSPVDQRCSFLQPGATRIGDLWSRNGASHALEVRDPACDWRVVEQSLRIPDHWFRSGSATNDSLDRMVLRTALRGLLPEQVRTNRRRGLQSADVVQRVNADLTAMDAAVESLRRGAAHDVIDVDRIRAVLDAAQSDPRLRDYSRVSTIALRGIMAGRWLNGMGR